MKSKTLSNSFMHMCRAAVVLIAAGSLTVLFAQTPVGASHHDGAAAPGMAQAGAMMADQKAMMARMAAADKKLAELAARMNAANGDEKVTAMAALLNELLAQRMLMQKQMSMQSGMMAQMMSHMAAMHGPAAMTPKQAPEPTRDPTDADHPAHHPEQ